MLTVAVNDVTKDKVLNRLDETAKCGGDLGFFHRAKLKVFELNQSQMILDNREMGPSQANLSQCGGGSGGIYFRTLPDGSIHLVGIHSASLQSIGPYLIHGKTIFLPVGFFGGTNLLAPEPARWLNDQITKFDLQVCGLNLSCQGVKLD